MSRQVTEAESPVANGMPMLGLGTWQNDDPEQCAESVRTALETGHRHVDTANAYRNEAAVGDGLASADVDAEDVFVATKGWKSDLAYDDAIQSAGESREDLGVDTIGREERRIDPEFAPR